MQNHVVDLARQFEVDSRIRPVMLACVLAALLPDRSLRADDWPQWRGPNRNGCSQETAWRFQWPAGGPKKLWEVNVGIGYSSFSASHGRLYTMGNVQETDQVYCFDAETGKPLWKHTYPCSSKDPNGYLGTRCTPTIDESRVYSVSRRGQLFCLDTANGNVIWSKDFKTDFGGQVPTWGFSGSPLIEADWVLVESGGKGASVTAMNKRTGEIIWKNGDDSAGYASLVAFDNGGQRCLAQFSEKNIIGRRMKDGTELWRFPWKTSYGVNAATPIIEGDEMFLSSGYGYGCAVLKISASGAREIWRNKSMRNHVNSCVLVGGYLFGYDENELKCLDWKNGEVKWATAAYGKGSLIAVGQKLILYGQNGKLGVAEASPDSFKELSSFQALTGKDTWAPPVLANGRIYVRSLETMAAFDVKSN
jgi:outer membrane protein assembly factor BamB